MSDESVTRRDFLTGGLGSASLALGAMSGLHAVGGVAPAEAAGIHVNTVSGSGSHNGSGGIGGDFTQFSRFKPSFGGPPGSPHYLGKMVPGFRKSGMPPVPLEQPDIGKVPWKMVRGAKEFELHAMAVKREFLPGYFMNVWGYNGTMPGPTIEAFQGDRVRIIVHNDLPEPTSVHWHGFELPIAMDGVPGLVQDLIMPGKHFVYEFDLHQTGSFFYHAHVAMQEAMGMCGFFVVHPRVAYDPPVDRDFGLIYQNFMIPPNADIADTSQMDWNFHTINGRSGPYSTPMVVKHGERVRVRLLNFSAMQHHPIHFHGHTFWLTGTEGGRVPPEAWIPRNNTLVGVAMVQDFEFIANNPGDWIFHCHMVHHMMNHMVRQNGPRVRPHYNVMEYMANLDSVPEPQSSLDEPGFKVPGYPQLMKGMMMSQEMSAEAVAKYNEARETRGMRKHWYHGVDGLMTVLRVLPEQYYNKVMHSTAPIEPGEIFDAIARSTLTG